MKISSQQPSILNRALSSLQVRLTITIVGIFLCALWLFALLLAGRQEAKLREMMESQQVSTVVYLASEIDGKVKLRLDTLKLMAGRLPTFPGNPTGLSAYLKDQAAAHRLFDGGLIVIKPDLSGAWADDPPEPGRCAKPFSFPPFTDALKKGEPAVGPPHTSRFSREPVVAMAVPVIDARGRVVAILAGIANINTTDFLGPVVHYRPGRTGDVKVIAPESGVVVTGSGSGNTLNPVPGPGTLPLYDWLVSHEGSAVGLDHFGKEQLASSHRIGSTGWLAVIRMPTEEAFAPVRQQRYLILSGAGGLSVIVAVLAGFFARRSLRPVGWLAERMDEISRGEVPLQALPARRPDEVGLLVESFNRMQAGLREEGRALRESENRLRTLVDAIPDSIQFKDREGRWLVFNRTALKAFGLEGFDCAGQTDKELSRLVEPRFREALLNCHITDEVAWNAGLASRVEETLYRPDGSALIFDVIKVPLFEENGERKDIVIVGRDVTASRQAEAELRQLSEALRQCTETIMLADTSQHIQYVNPAFERMFGYSLSEVKGRHLSLLLPREGENPGPGVDDNSIVSDITDNFEGEKWRRAKDGRLIPVLLKVASVIDANGAVAGLVGTMTDLTEIREAEKTLRESEARLIQSQHIAAVGHYTFDIPTGGFVCSEVVDEIFGISETYPRTLEGWLALIDPADRREMAALFLHAFRDLLPFDHEFRIVRFGNGEERWLHAIGHPEQDAAGSPARIFGVVQDISEQKKSGRHLALVKFALDHVNQAVYMADEQGRFRYVNEGASRVLGYTGSELLDMGVADIDVQAPDWPRMWGLIKSKGTATFEGIHKTADGRPFPVEINASYFEYEGSPYILGLVRDITERKESETALRLAASVFENAHEGICITDCEQKIIEVNSTFCDLTGYSREDLIGQTPRIMQSGQQSPDFYDAMWQSIDRDGHWQGEVWNRRSDGTMYAERLTISAVTDERGEVTNYVGVHSDITASKQHEAQLEKSAHYDALTGIPNRTLLADRIHQAIARALRTRCMMAVCYLDLDGFKPINDTFGHAAGDGLLVEIANRLNLSLRGDDTVARLGGDEFVLLLQGIEQVEEARTALQRILDEISRSLSIGDQSVSLSASVGVTLFPLDHSDPDTLLRHADMAMYLAKQNGKNQFHIFDPESGRITRDRRLRPGTDQGEEPPDGSG